jgi:hypothetical protein
MMEKERVRLGGRLGGCRDMRRFVDDVVVHVEVEMMVAVGDFGENLEVERKAVVGYFGVVQREVEMKVVVGYFVDEEKLLLRGNMACLVKFEDSQVIVAIDLVRWVVVRVKEGVEGGTASSLVAVSTSRRAVMTVGRSSEETDLWKEEVVGEGCIRYSLVVDEMMVKLEPWLAVMLYG